MEQQTKLQEALAQFIGTEDYHFNPLYRWLKYTDGVHYFANHAGNGAYWFLDIVGTELRNHALKHGFLDIDLVVTAGNAVIAVGDGNGRRLKRWTGIFTDCPTGEYKFFLQRDVLMLSSEY